MSGTEDLSSDLIQSFPQFSRLPIELRLKIWQFAMFPRLIQLHLHEYASNEERPAQLQEAGINGDEDEDPDEWEYAQNPFQGIRGRYPTMAITTCSGNYPCGCKYLPPRSHYRLPSPAILSVCSESRQAIVAFYSTVLNKIYNARGQAVVPASYFFTPHRMHEATWEGPYDPSETGVFMNPAVDIPIIPFNVKSIQALRDMDHLIAIASKEIPSISRVVFRIYIAMPYMFWNRERFQKWKQFGPNGDWVPRKLVQLKKLREVALLVEGKVLQKMLPAEWRQRTVQIWQTELLRMSNSWPEEWEGIMPTLRVITALEEL